MEPLVFHGATHMPRLTYYGHSAFRIRDERHAVLIDPFLTGNPLCKMPPDQLPKCDYILLTHGHADHFGDTLELAQRHSATVIATHELAVWCMQQGLKAHGMAIGGAHEFPFGRVKVIQALHGSGSDPLPDGRVPPPNSPVGFVVTWGKTKSIYHSGDTGLFSDMKLVSLNGPMDVALLPIGDNYTMGVDDAAQAAAWVEAHLYVPMHFNTFSVIAIDPLEFAYRVEKLGRRCKVMKPGEEIEV